MEMTEMERTCEEIEKENQEYLAVFEEELKKKGLSERRSEGMFRTLICI